MDNLAIGFVAEQLGVSTATLRKWESRYGFPIAGRSIRGHRQYSHQQFQLLQHAVGLIRQGQRPAVVFARGGKDLQQSLLESDTAAQGQAGQVESGYEDVVANLLQSTIDDDLDRCRYLVRRVLQREPVVDAVESVLVPWMRQIGEAWIEQRLDIYQEHAISQLLQEELPVWLQQQGQRRYRKTNFCLLMGTPSGERHSLALKLLQAVLISQRVRVVDLGADLPVETLASAVKRYRADALALSIYSSMAAPVASRYLDALDRVLPAGLPLWLGGQGVYQLSHLPARAKVYMQISDVLKEFDGSHAAS